TIERQSNIFLVKRTHSFVIRRREARRIAALLRPINSLWLFFFVSFSATRNTPLKPNLCCGQLKGQEFELLLTNFFSCAQWMQTVCDKKPPTPS
ncbi:MAG: hypothetical protein WCI87_07975, partial [Euryarchaeota archaeon]